MATLLPYLSALRDIAVTVAAGFGAYLAWKRLTPASTQADAALLQAQLARRSHVTELFNRAVGQLRDPNLEVRLGAIYVLREIARDFPDLAAPVFELLQALLRESTRDYGEDEPPVDVRAIMDILLRDDLGES